MTVDESADRTPEVADEGFLQRWSRRKSEPGARAAPATAPLASVPEAEPPGDADMVPVESLTEESDYAPFLSPRVSAELQRLALRKLFSAPSFNRRDGLDDYDDDFTSFAKLGDVITADVRHRLELAAQRLAAAAQGDPAPAPPDDPPQVATAAATSSPADSQERTTG